MALLSNDCHEETPESLWVKNNTRVYLFTGIWIPPSSESATSLAYLMTLMSHSTLYAIS